jgi:4-methyl-5(b-hydroxyethyl)-thiazole monophosphate biosynthesis
LQGAIYTGELVTKDGSFITGRGPAAAMEFGYVIAEHFLGEEAVAPLREGMIYNQMLNK